MTYFVGERKAGPAGEVQRYNFQWTDITPNNLKTEALSALMLCTPNNHWLPIADFEYFHILSVIP